MATYSSVLAWRTPGIGEPGGLPSMGLHRVGHDWSDLAAAAAAAAAFIGRTDAEAETPILWPPHENRLSWKDPDARKDWKWEEKGSLTQCTWSLSGFRELVMDRMAWRAAVHEVIKSQVTEGLNWLRLPALPDSCPSSHIIPTSCFWCCIFCFFLCLHSLSFLEGPLWLHVGPT